MSNLIAIFADGLGFHYTEYKSVRASLKNVFPNFVPLRSMLGFSAGLVPSLWTSSYPQDHGYWVRWMLRKDYLPSPIRINYLEWLVSTLALYSAKKVQILRKRPSFLEPAIPRSIRRLFVCKDIDATKAFFCEEVPSLFSILDINGMRYYYSFCKRIEDIILPRDNMYDICVFYLGEVDGLGHTYGPQSKITVTRILKLLDVAKKLVKKTRYLCLFSDHGMFSINARVNLFATLSKLRSKLGKDYLVFLDATMARFWFFNNYADEEITSVLSKPAQGHFLKPKELQSEGLNFETNSYGDKIYLMEPSNEVYPNYFHPIYANLFKGLHGYAPSAAHSDALFAATFDLKRESGVLLDVSPTMLELLGVKPPKNWKGRSLIN